MADAGFRGGVNASRPGRALVTGAAGMLGRHVLEAFSSRSVLVTALIQSSAQADAVEADRVVVGDARDVEVVASAVRDVDVVVHLAALASPSAGAAEAVFCGNTAATFVVLEQAAVAGISRAVIASSHSATGLPFARQRRLPPYLPLDESVPLQVEDPYGLSKVVDEATAHMMWWRHGLGVTALRFPFLGGTEGRLAIFAKQAAEQPEKGARDLWGYLDYRDAARYCVEATRLPPAMCRVLTLAVPVTISPYPTQDLVRQFFPTVPCRRSLSGRTGLFDTTRACELLGPPEHIWPVEQREYGGDLSAVEVTGGGLL